MNNIKQAIKRELTGWKMWQVVWLVFTNIVILGVV